MIASFLDSWSLFHATYLCGWFVALLLSLVGVLVVARDQIFVGAAISQASTLGIALAMFFSGWAAAGHGSWLESESFLSLMGVSFSVLAAVVTSRGGGIGRESHEAITGWIFLVSASVSVLIVSHSPHGLEEIHRLVSSSIIGATMTDVWIFAVLAAGSALFLIRSHRKILLLVLDPVMAAAVGIRTRLWLSFISLWLGMAVGLSITVSGMLYTFGCLVLPALAAKSVCREVRQMFVLAPLIALVGSFIGFVVANYYDYPPPQMTVAVLSLFLVAAWSIRALRDS